jgi:putative N6-adenine-specific DNA methylase
MPSESPLIKRIKRHVVGRTRDYFAVSAPGFENLCLNELRSLETEHLTASAETGGVAFKGRLQDCYLANLNLRTASRILMRIDTVQATHFGQLQKKLSDIPWELFLRNNPLPKVHVTTRHCKLYHSEAISERLLAAVANRKKNVEFIAAQDAFEKVPQTLHVRGADDRFMVSIDSSGENLYKRGIKRHGGTAPLRETAAAAALMLAGYTGCEPLVDPMCGSGTFALEAALMAKNIPPGLFRDFAFMGWPSYQHKRWEYIKHESKKRIVVPKTGLIFASDKNEKACRQLIQCVQQYVLDDTVTVSHMDFFEIDRNRIPEHPGIITINPPYGRRMGTRQKSAALFSKIINSLQKSFKGWRLILLVPGKPTNHNVQLHLKNYPYRHGGLKLNMMVGLIE